MNQIANVLDEMLSLIRQLHPEIDPEINYCLDTGPGVCSECNHSRWEHYKDCKHGQYERLRDSIETLRSL
jgi:hypothetical protein